LFALAGTTMGGITTEPLTSCVVPVMVTAVPVVQLVVAAGQMVNTHLLPAGMIDVFESSTTLITPEPLSVPVTTVRGLNAAPFQV